jgi:hypothetical protein
MGSSSHGQVIDVKFMSSLTARAGVVQTVMVAGANLVVFRRMVFVMVSVAVPIFVTTFVWVAVSVFVIFLVIVSVISLMVVFVLVAIAVLAGLDDTVLVLVLVGLTIVSGGAVTARSGGIPGLGKGIGYGIFNGFYLGAGYEIG